VIFGGDEIGRFGLHCISRLTLTLIGSAKLFQPIVDSPRSLAKFDLFAAASQAAIVSTWPLHHRILFTSTIWGSSNQNGLLVTL
jgi:hypothetical protein